MTRKHLLLLLLIIVTLTPGCVRRRLLVRSNPPGAAVHVDNQPIGVTPCGVDFVYYGTREVRLSKPGYETLTVNQPIPTPWYQIPVIDFFSENLNPRRVEDIRTVSYNLVRQRMAPAQEVIARGQELRNQVTPLNAAPIGTNSAATFEQPTTGFPPNGVGPLQPQGNAQPTIPFVPQPTPEAGQLIPSQQSDPILLPTPNPTFSAPPATSPTTTPNPTSPPFRY